jgi:hypothetical protein
VGSAKDMVLRPITAQEANALVRRVHYSGKVATNSQVHIGVFYQGKLEGAMQFGPSIDKRKLQGLVEGTGWNEFIELNRMAFTDVLPRNSESRALSISMKLLRKHAPHIKWVVTFADGTQCGDGTIYRASGFVLTGIKQNNQILEWNGQRIAKKTLDNENYPRPGGKYFSRVLLGRGEAKPLPGFQLRYLYFIDPTCRERLTVPILPFSEIERRGAGMYRGKPRAGSVDGDTPADHAGEGGSIPTSALHRADAPISTENPHVLP